MSHLVVRAPNWVGDLVMSTPILAAACEGTSWERVSVWVRSNLAGVLGDGPWSDALCVLPKGAKEAELYAREEPDAVLLLSNSFGAAWRAWRAHVPRRFGSALSGRRALLTHAVRPPTRAGRRVPVPSVHLMRDVAGLAGVEVDSLHPRLYAGSALAEDHARRVGELGLDAGYVLCCPGAAFGSAKLWSPDRFAQVLDVLGERHGLEAIVTGGPGEELLVEEVVGRCRRRAQALPAELRNLEALKTWVRGARLLLVGDSGPRWYAAAFDVPCVSLMGPNFPELTASSLEWCTVVRVEDLECSPCLKRHCPLGHHRCMQDLEPDRVVEAAERLLARAAGAGA